MTVSLEGKSAIVTGAAVGIGNAFARALAVQGVNLSICDIRGDDLEDFAITVEQIGIEVESTLADVSVPADVHSVVDKHISRFGGIDLLVSNAGTWAQSEATDALDKSDADWDKVVGTNFAGVFLFGRAVIPHMIAHGGGNIVNISTDHFCTCGSPNVWNHDDAPNCPHGINPPRPVGGGSIMDLYDAGKSAINGLTLSWAKALHEQNVRVNAFCMGATDSHMLRGFNNFDPDPAEEAKLLEELGWMKAEDIADCLVELVKEGTEGRSGENIGFALGHPVRLPKRQPIPTFMYEPLS
jgi:NAD(P)-dependent dehydrogenase (short-subunit alcohol dehydrogenase family)